MVTYVASTLYNQTIASPNYPLNYDNNLFCSWLIKVDDTAPSLEDFVVKVTFNDFSMEYRTDPCKDVLTFYDGYSTGGASLLGSFCGTTSPEAIYSNGKYMLIKFDTDSVTTYKGFWLSFSAVREG